MVEVAKMFRLAGFLDEASLVPGEMLAVGAACGLRWYSPRFVDLGNGKQNVMTLRDAEVDGILAVQKRFGVQVATLGSPFGKSLLVNKEEPELHGIKYLDEAALEKQLNRAIALCQKFGTNRLRGFSFYPPYGADPWDYLEQAVEWLKRAVAKCAAARVVYCVEIEANIVGQNGKILAELVKRVNNPWLRVVWDGGNVVSQGFTTADTVAQFELVLPFLVGIHGKDHTGKGAGAGTAGAGVKEEVLKFVPVGQGAAGYPEVITKTRSAHVELLGDLAALDIADIVFDLEPHARKGGTLGGDSGPDGFGVAVRAFTGMMDRMGHPVDLIEFDELDSRHTEQAA